VAAIDQQLHVAESSLEQRSATHTLQEQVKAAKLAQSDVKSDVKAPQDVQFRCVVLYSAVLYYASVYVKI
jgi:hypothetical protein